MHDITFNQRPPMILHVLIAMVAGWLQRHQQQVITYLLEGNRVLKAHLGGRRLRSNSRRGLNRLIFNGLFFELS